MKKSEDSAAAKDYFCSAPTQTFTLLHCHLNLQYVLHAVLTGTVYFLSFEKPRKNKIGVPCIQKKRGGGEYARTEEKQG